MPNAFGVLIIGADIAGTLVGANAHATSARNSDGR